MTRLRIIRALRGSLGLTDTDLSRVLGIPRASARRLIGELRASGVSIASIGGFYRLEEQRFDGKV